ncbi:uncharacterized protein EDB91DRAFT_1144546 [Suillus paluster]|uniref:uncharacterized protein n=1 Tax=Suillus paluster TaxID=48578 RepID=UPI001B86F6D5|nr:uncharacterized protein EDB91DRAFT_1144546 [Suillus paluster]KAG1735647.1 hypothetical protein EDB91DRAFT_1144546 [Suillus paluster]
MMSHLLLRPQIFATLCLHPLTAICYRSEDSGGCSDLPFLFSTLSHSYGYWQEISREMYSPVTLEIQRMAVFRCFGRLLC